MLHNSYQLKNLTLIASVYYSKLASGAVIHIIGLQISKGVNKKKLRITSWAASEWYTEFGLLNKIVYISSVCSIK